MASPVVKKHIAMSLNLWKTLVKKGRMRHSPDLNLTVAVQGTRHYKKGELRDAEGRKERVSNHA